MAHSPCGNDKQKPGRHFGRRAQVSVSRFAKLSLMAEAGKNNRTALNTPQSWPQDVSKDEVKRLG